MKILVTGAKGQLGTEMMVRAEASRHTYVFTDVLEDAAKGILQLDITDPNAIPADVDVIINCAAYTDVNRAESDEQTAMKVNALAPALLAKAAKASGALLIHISTDYVFDGKTDRPYRENDPAVPLSAYGRTKLAGEKAIETEGCRYMIFRTAWLYSNHGRNFFLTMARLTAEKQEVNVVDDQRGTPTYAGDLADLIYNIVENGDLAATGTYHYTDEGDCTWYEFAKAINDMLGHGCSVRPCRTEDYPSPAARPACSVLDKTKVKETFGIEIPHWRDSLAKAVNNMKL